MELMCISTRYLLFAWLPQANYVRGLLCLAVIDDITSTTKVNK